MDTGVDFMLLGGVRSQAGFGTTRTAPGRLCLLGCSAPANLSAQPQHPVWFPSDLLPKPPHHRVLSQG